MGEIIIHRGSQQIDLFSLIPFVTVTKAEHVQDLLSTDRITLSIASSQPMLFYLGDYIVYGGRKFTLNLNPTLQKQAEDVYLYDMQFEGVQYDLLRKKYFNYDAQGFYTTGDFPLTGEINVFLTALINNAKRDETDYTWILGYYPAGTETKTITFSNVNCLAALQTICQEFEQEFEIVQDMVAKTNTLNISKVGELRDYQFEYGYGNGLYSLKRNNVSEGQVITRLYPYGSTENIPTNYRNFSPRLRLPESYGTNYIQDNAKVALFGLVEEIKNYDDIKPTFKGIISGVGTAVSAQNTFSVSISNMDFDLNEKKADGVSTKYLIDGTPAKIHVNKGNLAGYEFEIHKYTHSTKTFEIKVFADERGQKFPDLNTIFKFAVGDEITLLDIIMPDVYITNAENKLKDKALEDYDKLSQNNVKYSLDIDPLFFANIGGGTDVAHLTIGDYISVKDTALGIQKTSRIISLNRDLLANDGYKYSADISDSYEISITTQILQDIQDIQTQVGVVVVRNKEAMLAGYQRMKELQGLVFDPDGYFDPTNIKPNSIETNMLTVGAKSQQLSLESVIIKTNVNNDPNSLSITAGKLIHFSISDTGIKEWNLTAINKTLPTNDAYYIYARVPKVGTTGTFNIVTSKLKFDSEDLYYNFLVAVVFSPSNNLRMTELMYGSTFIHGRTITTGRITSVDGLTWFDLDTGELHGKFTFTDGTNVQTAVAGAQATANTALSGINDMANDNKLTANEKQTTVVEWNRIKQEYTQNSSIGNTLGLSLTAYQNAYNTLNTYITPLLSDLTTTSTIDGNTFRNNFQNYYTQNVALVQAIENKKIDNVQIGGRNLLRNTAFNENINNWESNGFTGGVVEWNATEKALFIDNGNNNGAFLQNINIPMGDYMLSFDVKPAYQSGGFNVNIASPNSNNPVIAIHNTATWKRYSISVKYTADSTWIAFQMLSNQKLFFRNIKLEKGNKATDWTPANEDIDSAIANANTNSANALAQAQNALNTAASAAAVTSFMQTTIDGNVVSTGTLQVGDVNGANAGITGVTDNAEDSIRFFAGSTYQNKSTAPWSMSGKGIERTYHPNGNIATIRGIINGEFTFNFYHKNGYLLFKLDPNRGLINVAYTNESFTEYNFAKLNIISQTASDLELMNAISPLVTSSNSYYVIDSNKLTYICYEYFNGTLPENSIWEQYNGYKASKSKLDNIPDGWYITMSGILFLDSSGKPTATAVYFQNGVQRNQKIIVLTNF